MSLRGVRRIPCLEGREVIPGVPRPPETLTPGGQMAASQIALVCLAATPLCVRVRACVCVRSCACLRVCVWSVRFFLLCDCRNFRSTSKVFFRFSLISGLPRAVLGVLQPGLRGGTRRRLIGAKETRRGVPREALAD